MMEPIDQHALLADEETLFRASFEAAPIGMALLGRDGRFLKVNAAFLAMFATSETQLLKSKLADITHPDDIDETLFRIEQLNRGRFEGDRCELESRFLCPLRSALWGRLSLSLVRDATGKPAYTLGQLIDVGDSRQESLMCQARTQVLERLASGAPLPQILALLLDNARSVWPEMFCSVRVVGTASDGLFYGASMSLDEYLRQSAGGELGVGPASLAFRETQAAIVQPLRSHPYWNDAWERQMREHPEAWWSQPVLSSSGELFGSFEVYLPESAGLQHSQQEYVETAAQLAGIAIERLRAEQALRDSEAKYRDLVETSQDLIWLVDAAGNWTFVNRSAAETIYGYRPEEMLGRPFTDFVAFERQQEDLQAFKSIKRGQNLFDYETIHLRRDGSPVYLNFNAIGLYGEQGEILGATGTARDVSEQHRAAEALRRYQNKLQQMVETRTRELSETNRRLQQEIKEREQAERELERSAAEWTYAMDYFEEAIYLVDLDDRLVRANRSFYALTGLTPQTAIGRELPHSMHPGQDREDCPVCHARMTRTNTVITLEADHPSNPTGRPVEVMVHLVRDQHDLPAAILMGIHDLTQRRAAEAALRKSQNSLAAAQRIAHIGNWEYDLMGAELLWSDEVYRIFEIDPEQTAASRQAFLQTTHPDDREQVERAYRKATEDLIPYHIEHRLLMPDGRIKYVEESCEISVDTQGRAVSVIGTIQDISTRKLAENLERINEQVFHSASDRIAVVTLDYVYQIASKAYCEDYGLKENEILGRSVAEVVGRDRFETAVKPMLEACFTGEEIAYEGWFDLERGQRRYLVVNYSPLRDSQGRILGALAIVHDITERKHSEQLLYEEKERALVTLTSIADAVISTGPDGCIDFVNPVAEGLTGWSAGEACGRQLPEVFRVVNEETGEPEEDPVARCMKQGRVIEPSGKTLLLNPRGGRHAIEDSAAPIRGRDGELLGVVLVFRDVTQARHESQKVSYQASHDALTGLINRREFERRLSRVLETAQSADTENTLCYLDLDRFKQVNDTCGHVAGDELLRQVSQLLTQQIRKRDTLARLGGDEFGLLMEHCSINEAKAVVENLIKVVGEFSFPWEEQNFSIGVSIGMVDVSRHSAAMHQVLQAADSACYLAKEQGRNRLHVHQATDAERFRRHTEMQWAERLPRALDEGRFRLCFQPIKPLDGSLEATPVDQYEVLVQLLAENGASVPPGAFLPAAERYRLSERLDRWIIRRVLRWLGEHPQHLQQLRVCSINLSGPSLGGSSFRSFVIEEIAQSGVAAHKLCFEIAETVAIANLSSTRVFIEALKAQGCLFALDDFGSGLSSFTYLKNLPVDFLKIDGLFIRDILNDPMALAMVKSINEIGHVMGKATIAKFVENASILQKLREIGVDYAQGFGIDRPRPLETLNSR
jgi:diguanylate cyclase (GGDEF)-like protein/PAS domain S-box-containing protein